MALAGERTLLGGAGGHTPPGLPASALVRNRETLAVRPPKRVIAQRRVGFIMGCWEEPSETVQDLLWDAWGKEQTGEREGSRQFGEELVWENRGKRGQKGVLGCLSGRAPCLITAACPVCLLNSL